MSFKGLVRVTEKSDVAPYFTQLNEVSMQFCPGYLCDIPNFRRLTLPETNIAPKNGGFQ